MSHFNKNKIENLEQRVDQLEMFISTLEEQNKFMKEIVTSQNDIIKFMAEQNATQLEKIATAQQQTQPKSQQSHDEEPVSKRDNEMHELLPEKERSPSPPPSKKHPLLNRRVL